jgi:hypothetical protein
MEGDPYATALTRMPLGIMYVPNDRVNEMMAPLVAE